VSRRESDVAKQGDQGEEAFPVGAVPERAAAFCREAAFYSAAASLLLR